MTTDFPPTPQSYRPAYPPSGHHRQKPPRKSRRGWIILLVIVFIAIALGIGLRLHHAHTLKKDTDETAVPMVNVTHAKRAGMTEEIILPGNVQAWHEATLYARTNGFLKRWVRTMGMHVKQGDLIAEIEAPEVDAQLRQAQADLHTAEANYSLAQSTAARWVKLLKTNSVSKQEADEKIGDARAKEALLNAARAERDRLVELEGFKNLRAPFDGIITSRTTDVGALINSGSGSQPLFKVVQADYLRIYVRVPQRYSAQIKPDLIAQLEFDEYPGQLFPATFVTTAQAIDPSSQTMLTEFKADNRSGQLLAGGYCQVHLKLPARETGLHVPVNTLLFRAEGPRLAILDAQNHAQLRPVVIGRDYGNEVEIASGVTEQESIIVNPPDSLFEGQEVRVAPPKQEKSIGDEKKNTDEKKANENSDAKGNAKDDQNDHRAKNDATKDSDKKPDDTAGNSTKTDGKLGGAAMGGNGTDPNAAYATRGTAATGDTKSGDSVTDATAQNHGKK